MNRSYTISSTPTRSHVLEITVKAIPDGLVSNYLHQHVKPGTVIDGTGPSGHFTCVENQGKKFLMLSGGSGVTPVMSMSRWLYDTGSDVDIVFVHCAQTLDDVIFHDELIMFEKRMPNFRKVLVLSNEWPKDWKGHTGYLSKDVFQESVPDFIEREIFLCGPEPFRHAAEKALEELMFDMNQYHYESFGGKPARPAQEMHDGTKFPCEFSLSKLEGEISPDETILECAEKIDINIASACRTGVCGTCKVKLEEGDVVMLCEDGLKGTEKEDGYVLACVAIAKNRIKVVA